MLLTAVNFWNFSNKLITKIKMLIKIFFFSNFYMWNFFHNYLNAKKFLMCHLFSSLIIITIIYSRMLSGILSELDYLKDIGVETICLNPIFSSPLIDFGYDISNYTDIDPIYGDLEDFDQLIEEAHEQGIFFISINLFYFVMLKTSD